MAFRDQLEPLLKHPTILKWQRRYDQLPSRDRRALQVLSLAVGVVLVYVLVWQPVADFRASAQARSETAQDLLGWIQSQEVQARQIAASSQRGQARELQGGDFLTTVTASAQKAGLPLQRFEPSGSTSMRIWLEKVAFNELAQWLDQLRLQHGIRVDQAAMDRSGEPGRVNARMTLEL